MWLLRLHSPSQGYRVTDVAVSRLSLVEPFLSLGRRARSGSSRQASCYCSERLSPQSLSSLLGDFLGGGREIPGKRYFCCHSEHHGVPPVGFVLAVASLNPPVSALTGSPCGPQAHGSSCHAPSMWMAPGCGSPTCGTTRLSPISWKPSERDSR